MSTEPQPAVNGMDIHEGDILFECPHCGKSMAIEPAGAGLMVACANCAQEVQVPIPDANTPEAPVVGAPRAPSAAEDPDEVIRQLDAALAMANDQIDRLIAEKESLQERRAYLEQMRLTNTGRFQQIAEKLAAAQEALDRAMELLAEARTEKPV